MARLYLLIQEMPLLVSGTLIKLGWKVKVNSRFGIDLLLGKNVGARGCFGFAPTPVDKSVSC